MLQKKYRHKTHTRGVIFLSCPFIKPNKETSHWNWPQNRYRFNRSSKVLTETFLYISSLFMRDIFPSLRLSLRGILGNHFRLHAWRVTSLASPFSWSRLVSLNGREQLSWRGSCFFAPSTTSKTAVKSIRLMCSLDQFSHHKANGRETMGDSGAALRPTVHSFRLWE